MANITQFNTFLSAGVRIVESADTLRTLPIVNHSNIYVFGASSEGDEFIGIPTLVSSYSDFIDKFGNPGTAVATYHSNVCAKSIELIFANHPLAIVYFIKASVNGYVAPSLLQNSFKKITKQNGLGFLVSPLTCTYSNLDDRVFLVNELSQAAQANHMFALIDDFIGMPDTVRTLNDILEEKQAYNNLDTGHSAMYYPNLAVGISGEGLAPVSPAIAAIATLRFSREGIKSPAGFGYPIKGIYGIRENISEAKEGALLEANINPLVNEPGKGQFIKGGRTTSDLLLYRFIHTRIIANVVNASFEQSIELKGQLFNLIDGAGVFLSNLEDAANSIGRQLYQGSNLLYGTSASEAFRAKCDFENNSLDNLQQGNVFIEFTYAVSPNVEKILVNTRLTSIGTVISSSEAGRTF